MSQCNLNKLELVYDSIEDRLPITIGSAALAQAVHFGTNRNRPIHRWFHFKEGFSADIFTVLGLDTAALHDPGSIFLDPFCGSGTTLVAGDLEHSWQGLRIGFEVNPFLAFVARTKVDWRNYDPSEIRRVFTALLDVPLVEDFSSVPRPALSSLQNPGLFPSDRLSALLDMVLRIRQLEIPECAPLLLGVAAMAERVALYRKDGRALRILRSPDELRDRLAASVKEALHRSWSAIVEDVEALHSQRMSRHIRPGVVVTGDGRAMSALDELTIGTQDVSLIVYSPPYLNHIDYTEVYKIELWLLGFVHSQKEMLALRKQTIRSHASIGISPATPLLPIDVEQAVAEANECVSISDSSWHRAFPRLFRAYLADMQLSLIRQYELLRPGARAVCIVANSAHGSKHQRVPVAVDLLIARLAEDLGFEVERFVVARQLLRRDHLNRYLRESVIILRRPSAS